MIIVKNLVKYYDNFKALDDVSFKIQDRGITGLLGPNGAGKTTTLKILTGYMSPSQGEVEIADLPMNESNIIKIKRKIGYLPENNPLYEDMTVTEYLLYMAELKGVAAKERKDQVLQVIKDTKLEEKQTQDISKLSKGYKQRVGLAQSLLGNPEILILDEPTVGLDPNQIVEIRELIKEIGKKKIVIFSSHILAEVEAICDNVIIINKGKIVAKGNTADLNAQASGKTKIDIIVETGHEEKIMSLLKEIEAIQDIRKVTSSNNEDMYSLQIQASVDIRRQIVNELQKNNVQLLELHRHLMKLEDTFAQLTQ